MIRPSLAHVLFGRYPLGLPKREWRNWQTRQLEVLVGVKSRGGSSPLSRILGARGVQLSRCPPSPFRGFRELVSTLHVSLRVSSLDGLALVVFLLSGTQTDEHLDSPVDKVHFQRHNCLPTLSSQIGPLPNLSLVR